MLLTLLRMPLKLTGFVLVVILAVSAQTNAPTPSSKTTGKKPLAHAVPNWKAVEDSAIVIDTHADTTGRFVDEGYDPSTDSGRGHWDLAKAKKATLGAEFFSVWIDPDKFKGHYPQRTLRMIDSIYQTVAKHPNDMVMAYSTKDIYAARRGPNKRIAILMGIEGGHAIENDMGLLRDYYRLGVRYMTLTWMNSNEFAQSSGDTKKDPNGKIIDPGMTEHGRQIVREMNRLGMMVDISHVSDRTFYNALTASRAPVIASHSSARAVTDVPRNMSDDMLIALARNGGVAQVNFNCGFISNEYNQQTDKYMKDHPEDAQKLKQMWQDYTAGKIDENQYQAFEAQMESNIPRPPLSALIDHIDHIAKIAGVDHVGIGSDFDGVSCLPQGIDSVADLPKITQALLERGYSATDVKKILGGNLLRVFAQVEKTAQEMQHETNLDKRMEVAVPPRVTP
jgi:membrane dipeptidase